MIRLFLIPIFTFISSFVFSQSITYHDHIAPIIQEHCYECHQKDGIAPISFSNYKEVSSYGAMIAYVTGIRYMPPWKVVQPKQHFQSERGLSDHEISLIKQWVDNGLKEGSPKKSKTATPAKQQQLPKPDVTYAMAEAFEQYGVYYDQFRVFVIPTDLAEDQEVASIAFVPGNKTIVRSCFISVDTTSKSKALDSWDPQYGYFSFGELGFVPMESRWYNWHPGKGVTHFKNGSGKRLPKGAKLLLHIHYGPTGIPKKDSSFLQINFAKEKITEPVYTAPLIHAYNMTNDTFLIVPEDSTRVHAKFVVPFDMKLHGLFPQSHLLGRKWEIFTVDPENRSSEVLLKITDWDFKWKQMYDFKEPKLLKKGTIVHALASYDNTLKNLSNPSNPPNSMAWGKRMFEEIFVVFFKFSDWQPLKKDKAFELHINHVNNTEAILKFGISNSIQTSLSANLSSFDGQHKRMIFENKNFKNGQHNIRFNMDGLPKGNYFIELTEPASGDTLRQILVYLEDRLFE